MKTLRQINIKNGPHYFFNDMINIKSFDLSLLDIDRISFKSTDHVIYHIECITMKSLENENIDSVNSLYLIFNNVDGYIECNFTECNSSEKSNENNTGFLLLQTRTKKYWKNCQEIWDEIKNQIRTISGDKPIKYERDFMKIRFESDDDLPLGKILSILVCIIAVESVSKKDNNYYPQAHLHEYL